MKYKITIREMEEGDKYSGRDIYEQIVDDIDVNALVISVNSRKEV